MRWQRIPGGTFVVWSLLANHAIPGSVGEAQTQPPATGGRRPNVSWENPGA